MVFWTREGSFAARGRKRPHTPEVRQGEHAECGLAALAILFGHHGLHVSMADLRREAGSTLFGSTVRQLRDLAGSRGFEAKAHRTEPADLPALGLPLIVHMRFIHFVVVEHVGTKTVHVNDPGCGPVILDRADFDRDFTGIALSLTPKTTATHGKAFSFPRAVLHGWQGQWVHLALAASASAAAGIAAVAGIWCLSSASSGGLPLLATSFCTAGAALLLAEQAGLGAQRRWAGTVHQALGKASNDYFLFTRPEQTLARFSAPDELQNSGLIRALLTVLSVLAALATGCVLAPGAVLPVALVSLVQMALVVRASAQRGGHIARHGHGRLAVQGIAAEHLADSDWYRIGRAGDGLFSMLAGMHARAATDHFKTASQQRILQTALFALDMAKFTLPLHLSTGGGLFLSLGLAAGSSVLLRRIGRLLPSQPLRDALHRLSDLPTASSSKEAPLPKLPQDDKLRLHNVGWSAGGHHAIIENLSCSVGPGDILVAHGPSGSGATTFARLASGMVQPTAGDASLDGRALFLHPPGTAILVDHFAPILPGTVRDNLALGSEGVDDAAMWAALGLVGLDETVARRGGLALVLKSDQPRLSGGQLRRIAIARALCRAPRLLVLDEALDTIETALVQTILARLRSTGLIVVVTTKNAELAGSGDAVLNLGSGHAA